MIQSMIFALLFALIKWKVKVCMFNSHESKENQKNNIKIHKSYYIIFIYIHIHNHNLICGNLKQLFNLIFSISINEIRCK